MKHTTTHPSHEAPTGKRLLIADPQVMFCEALANWMSARSPNDTVQWASDFDRTLRLAGSLDPHVVVLSAGFPRLDIRVALHRLTKQSSSEQTAIILLDNQLRISHLRAAVEFHLHGYWTKQEPIAAFAEAMQRAAEGFRTFCPVSQECLTISSGRVELRPPRESTAFSQLTSREFQVAILTAKGHSMQECAEALGVKESTIDNHKWKAMRKLRVHRTVELTLLALNDGLLD